MSLPPNASFQHKMSPTPEYWVNLPFFQGYMQTVQLISNVQTPTTAYTSAHKLINNNKLVAVFSPQICFVLFTAAQLQYLV